MDLQLTGRIIEYHFNDPKSIFLSTVISLTIYAAANHAAPELAHLYKLPHSRFTVVGRLELTPHRDHKDHIEAFITGVHTFIDSVGDAKGRAGEGLYRHKEEDYTDRAFTAGLAIRVEGGEETGICQRVFILRQ